MLERRRSHRSRVCLRGFLTEGPHSPIEPVQLRNLSEDGAEFVLPKGHIPSASIELRIPSKNQTRRAHVVWRHFERFGVEFAPWSEDLATLEAEAKLTEWTAALEGRYGAVAGGAASSYANPRKG